MATAITQRQKDRAMGGSKPTAPLTSVALPAHKIFPSLTSESKEGLIDFDYFEIFVYEKNKIGHGIESGRPEFRIIFGHIRSSCYILP